MQHRYQKPPAVLSGYVRTVLIQEGTTSDGGDDSPIFTNGMACLLCKTEKDTSGVEHITQLTLFGKSIPPACWDTNVNTTIIAYFFYPFVITTIFNVPATQVQEPLDLANWNPHQANAVRTQLLYASTTKQKTDVLDHLLIHQWELQKKECEMITYATNEIMSDPGTAILASIQQKLCLTERTFQRTFKKYVGITPNQYRRICQFQLSFAQVKSNQFDSFSDVAFANGFSDQSHFIRSFKEFTHTTPHHYLRDGLTEKK